MPKIRNWARDPKKREAGSWKFWWRRQGPSGALVSTDERNSVVAVKKVGSFYEARRLSPGGMRRFGDWAFIERGDLEETRRAAVKWMEAHPRG